MMLVAYWPNNRATCVLMAASQVPQRGEAEQLADTPPHGARSAKRVAGGQFKWQTVGSVHCSSDVSHVGSMPIRVGTLSVGTRTH